MSENEMLRELRELVGAQMIVEQSDGQFAFRHALMHEAVYSAMLLRDRKLLHQLAATTMEKTYGADLELHVAELAHQFYEAGTWDKALVYSTRAGQKAQAMYGLHEALAHYTRALDAARQLTVTPATTLLRARASAYEMLGDFERARADYEQALATARAQADVRAEWQLLLDLGLLWHALDFERSGEYSQAALRLARQLGDPATLGHTLNRVGNWRLNRDDPYGARRYHREALDIFEAVNDPHGIALTLELLAISSYNCSDVIGGVAFCERALDLFERSDDRQGWLHSAIHLPLAAHFDIEVSEPIDWERMSGLCESALRLAREMGWRNGEAEVTQIMAELFEPHGHYARALDAGQRSLALAVEMGHRAGVGMASYVLGHIHLDVLALEEAQRLFEQGLAAARESGATMFVHAILPFLASTYTLNGQLEQAESILTPLLQSDVEDASRHQRVCWYARAELALALKDAQLALEMTDRLIDCAPNIETHGRFAIPKLSRLHADALAALGRLDHAEAELRATLEVAQRQGKTPLQWRIQSSLGSLYRRMGRDADAEREFIRAGALIETIANELPDERLRDKFRRRAQATWSMHPLPVPGS